MKDLSTKDYIAMTLARSSAEGRRLATLAFDGEPFADLEPGPADDYIGDDGERVEMNEECWINDSLGEPLDGEPSEIPSHDPIINGPRTGRNEPCPCGSGVKFKRCCYGKEST